MNARNPFIKNNLIKFLTLQQLTVAGCKKIARLDVIKTKFIQIEINFPKLFYPFRER